LCETPWPQNLLRIVFIVVFFLYHCCCLWCCLCWVVRCLFAKVRIYGRYGELNCLRVERARRSLCRRGVFSSYRGRAKKKHTRVTVTFPVRFSQIGRRLGF
jgi:hypothetical protein